MDRRCDSSDQHWRVPKGQGLVKGHIDDLIRLMRKKVKVVAITLEFDRDGGLVELTILQVDTKP